ncbi:MAG: hypothetical protein ACXVB1_07545, partial [Pseudobdellovibrionaceae bacterium]
MSLAKYFKSKCLFISFILGCFQALAHPSEALKCHDVFSTHPTPFLSVERYLSDPQIVMKYGQPEQFQRLAAQSSSYVLIETHLIREVPVAKVHLDPASNDRVVWTSPEGDHTFYNEFSWVKYRSNVNGQIT